MLPVEARRLAFPKKNQFSSELQNADVLWKSGVIQKALRQRAITVDNLRRSGLNDRQVIGVIASWYRGKKGDSSTWLFVKSTYSVPTREIHSYKTAVRARARAMVSKLGKNAIGLPYGKRLPKPTKSTLVIKPQEQFPNF
jgi:hypothetical protein